MGRGLPLMVEIYGSEMFASVRDFLQAHNLRIVFEKTNDQRKWSHIMARKS